MDVFFQSVGVFACISAFSVSVVGAIYLASLVVESAQKIKQLEIDVKCRPTDFGVRVIAAQEIERDKNREPVEGK